MTSFEVWRRLQKFQSVRPPVRRQYATRSAGKRLLVLLLGLALIVPALGGLWFLVYKGLARSDFFQITAIKIEGCRRASKGAVLELSDIDVHTSLLSLDVARVKRAILGHEWIQKVEIDRDWPNRLVITVTERLPVALINLEDGLHYLDQQGKSFAQVLPPEDLDFPVITGFEQMQVGEDRKQEALREALHFIRLCGRGNTPLPKQNISELHLTEKGELLLYLVNRPIPIHLGAGEVSLKYQRLTRVLDWLYRTETFAETAYIRMDFRPDQVLVGKAEAG